MSVSDEELEKYVFEIAWEVANKGKHLSANIIDHRCFGYDGLCHSLHMYVSVNMKISTSLGLFEPFF